MTDVHSARICGYDIPKRNLMRERKSADDDQDERRTSPGDECQTYIVSLSDDDYPRGRRGPVKKSDLIGIRTRLFERV